MSPNPAEPSEEELRAMIERRDCELAVDLRKRKRLGTWFLSGLFAGVSVVFLSFEANREWLALMLSEPVPEPLAGKTSTPVDPDGVRVKQVAWIPVASDVQGTGRFVDQGDIRFGMELMQFMELLPRASEQDPGSSPANNR